MGAVTILDHIAVTVSDMERSLAFYCGLLGLPDGNLLELNEIGTGQQLPHDFDWTED